jgi:hypothetical protein
MADARYFVTYVGTGVVELPGAGVFGNGISAYVSEEVARAALAQGGWSVKDPSGKEVGSMPAEPKPAAASAPAPAPAPKAEEKKPEEKKPEKADEKKAEEKPAEAAAKA